MKELTGNIWNSDANVICITTNGTVRKNGRLVMGKGIAKEAVKRYPDIDKILGYYVTIDGNIPCIVECEGGKMLASFPTKNNWRFGSDIRLIIKSAKILQKIIPDDYTVALPRPGCSSGGLKWSNVKLFLYKILDDRFTVYDYNGSD